MNENPDLFRVHGAVEPGEYDCEWTIDGQQIPGTIELRAGRPPVGHARINLDDGAVPGHPGRYALSFPQERSFSEVHGFIGDRQSHVVLTEVTATTWFSERTTLAGSAAIVSHGSQPPVALSFSKATFQVTRLDHFSGLAPLTEQQLPRSGGEEVSWGASATRLSRRWIGESAELTFYYSYRSSIDPYLLSVRFAPWIEIVARTPLSVREWFEHWCHPMVHLIAAATGGAEETTHLKVEGEDGAEFTVFANPITQAPFYSQKKSDSPLAFTAKDDAFSLVGALEAWKGLSDGGHPLVAGYNALLLSGDQHPRGRVLLLIQWLEGAFGFENRDRFEAKRKTLAAERTALLAKLRVLSAEGVLTAAELRLCGRIPKRVDASLGEALRHYAALHPALETEKYLGELSIVVNAIPAPSTSTLDGVREIRNRLSHGSVDYELHDLRDLAKVLHLLVRAEYLRLLGGGFDAESLRWIR